MKSFATSRRTYLHAEWRRMNRRTKGLLAVAEYRAIHHEPNPQFPGVDIDAVHYKRPALKEAA